MIKSYVVCNIVFSLFQPQVKITVMESVSAVCRVDRYLGIEGAHSQANKSYIVNCMEDPVVKQLTSGMNKTDLETFNDYSEHIVTEEDCDFNS